MQSGNTTENCFAHTLVDRPPADWETLAAHLHKVAESTATFADAFGAQPWGQILGRCHDLGKLSEDFQRYIKRPGAMRIDAGVEDDDRPSERVDHSTFVARYVAKFVGKVQGQLLAFCIAGHHTGLPDETSADDVGQRPTLRYKLDPASYTIPAVAQPDIVLPTLTPPIKHMAARNDERPFQLAFFTRMLFSCLTDADRTRTEELCDPVGSAERNRHNSCRPSLAMLKDRLDATLQEKQAAADPTEVNRQRNIVLEHCRVASGWKPGFFSLNVPTGGGKTLSSLSFALEHALKPTHNLRRVVMAIPFTSIIEQTADVYRAALGPLAEAGLIEHHTNLQPVRATRANQLSPRRP